MNNKNLELEAAMSAIEMYPVIKIIYEIVKDIDEVPLFCVLSSVIDAWAADHKLSKEETVKLLERMTKVQKEYCESEK